MGYQVCLGDEQVRTSWESVLCGLCAAPSTMNLVSGAKDNSTYRMEERPSKKGIYNALEIKNILQGK